MIGKITLVILFFCCAFVNAQDTPKFKVLGTVTNQKDKTVIPNCPIVLKGSDGILVQTRTDTQGKYEIKLRSEVKYEIYTTTDRTVTTPTSRWGFLASDDHGSFTTAGLTESQNFQKDFELQPLNNCGPWWATIVFVKNSVEFSVDYSTAETRSDSDYYLAPTTINTVYKTLISNPGIVMEISAHASKREKQPNKLSQLRAEKVKAELVKMGVNENRLVAKGYGVKKLKVQTRQIRKSAKTKREKEALHAINRRCIFKIINWEFEEKK